MYKAIVFDLDGTLLDTTEGVLHAVELTISQLGLKKKESRVLNTFVGPPMQLSFELHYGMDKDRALDAATLFRKNYKEKSLFLAELYPMVLETLELLKKKGYILLVATNKSHDNAIDILKHFGIFELCDYAEGSDMQGKLKKADIILHCCEKVKVKPEECVYIGDSIFDLEGAEKVGMNFIAALYGFGFSDDDRTNAALDKYHKISKFDECLEIL